MNIEKDRDPPQWLHVALKVSLFSTDELPLKEPSPLPTYSIGEEISNSAPIAIAWSPSGLAKHRGCALAILTANLVLSIWSASGNPQDEASWKRQIVVNKTVLAFFSNAAIHNPTQIGSEEGELTRLRSRIRSFAWAPALPGPELAGTVGMHMFYSQHVLAASNDDNQIIFIAIDSPTSTLGAEHSWSARVLDHISLTPSIASTYPDPTVFEELLSQQRHVTQLAWSPWFIRGNQYKSVIAYATNDNVRARDVTYANKRIVFSDETTYFGAEVRVIGPLRWSCTGEVKGAYDLAVLTASGLTKFTISACDASIVKESTHDIGNRWDGISGAIWDNSQQSILRLHVSSLLSTLYEQTSSLEVSVDGMHTIGSPVWRDQIENNLVLFSARNDLRGHSKAKVWGLTVSPLGDFVASCHSVHPSDMIEYGPPGDRRVTIAISTLQQYTGSKQAFPSRAVSSEGLLFTIRKAAENTIENPEQIAGFVKDVVDKLIEAYPSLESNEDVLALSARDIQREPLDALVEQLKKAISCNTETLRDRYSILVNHACDPASSNIIPATLIAYRLAQALQPFSSILVRSSLSTNILALHQRLLSLIDTLAESKSQGGGPAVTSPPEPRDHDLTTNSTSDLAPEIQLIRPKDLVSEACDFCSAPIPFIDLETATCTHGHSFPRCGLSFLAIQAPGITKYCGICQRPFLNDDYVATQESGHDLHTIVEPLESMGNSNMVAAALSSGDQGRVGKEINDRQGLSDNDPEHKFETSSRRIRTRNADQQGPMHARLLGGGPEKHRPAVTFATLLFLSCDVCIYCGGHFVG